MEKNELQHSAHSTWRCQHHLVFAPKFRRKAIYGAFYATVTGVPVLTSFPEPLSLPKPA